MRGRGLTLLVLGAVLLARTAAAAAGAGDATPDSGPMWGRGHGTTGNTADNMSPNDSDATSTTSGVPDSDRAATGSEDSESDTTVEDIHNVDVSQSTKTEKNYTNDIIITNINTKEVNKDTIENKALSVKSNKDDDNTNTRISNESTNENNRISKKSSTLTEVVSNKLATEAVANKLATEAVANKLATEAVANTVAGSKTAMSPDSVPKIEDGDIQMTNDAKASACPSTCACSGGVLLSAQCTLRGGAGITVTREGDKYTVECQISTTAHVPCADLPSLSPWLKPSRTDGITLAVRGCDLRIGCLVGSLDVKVISLMIQDAEEWRIQEGDVTGMQDLQELGIYYHEYPYIPFPWSTASSLPRLRTLTLSGATLSLPRPLPPFNELTRLELSNCRLSNITLTPGVFKQLRSLERLYLQNNQLTHIHGGVFEGLSNLLELGISSNQLSEVPVRELATHCPRLTVLSAFDNAITDLPHLRQLDQLTELELFYNRVPLTLQPGCLAHLPRLRVVDLRDSGVTSLPRDVVANSTSLRTLLLQGNHIQELEEGLFMQQQELETLDLSNNNLTKLNPDVFSGLTALKELRLDGNNITELTNGVTSGLRSLRALSMRDAHLTTIGVSALSGCVDLATLLLSGNRLTTVWMDPHMIMDQIGLILNGLRQLEVIDLSRNNLTAVPSAVTSLLSLKRLDLSTNLIGHVDDLNYLSESVTVDLSHNRIQSLSLIEADTKDGDSITSVVLLEDNPFVCNCLFYNAVRRIHGYRHPYVDKVTLEFGNSNCSAPALLTGRQVTSLREEDVYCDVTKEDYCNDGPNTCLPDDCTIAFRQYTKSLDVHCKEMPETLPDINGWPVTGIRLTLDTPPPSWTNLTGVRMLNLSGSGLRTVPAGVLPTSVQAIDLSDNNLTDIPVELLNNNVTLHLSGNPLRCDCWSSSRVSLLQQRRHLVADYDNATCASASPSGVPTPLRRVNAEQLCSAQTAAAIGGTLAAVGLIAGVLAVVLLRYRVEVEILLLKAGLLRRRDESDDGNTYDAFVSYAHEDDAFVTQRLLPRLEGGGGMRLCIHSRDWLPGEWISSSIAASVAHSRRTLIVLSNNFLRSRWGRLEFQAATSPAAGVGGTGRGRVIIVLLEDVSHHPDLDPELRAYLRTNTYLKWGDPWFWDKLLHALPHHSKRQPRAPTVSHCDVIAHHDVLQRVAAAGHHPADVIMAAKGKHNPGYDGTHDKHKQNQSLNVMNDIKNDKLNDKLNLNPMLGVGVGVLDTTRNDAFNDKLKDSLSNKLAAVEATLDALEQLEGKRNKAFK